MKQHHVHVHGEPNDNIIMIKKQVYDGHVHCESNDGNVYGAAHLLY